MRKKIFAILVFCCLCLGAFSFLTQRVVPGIIPIGGDAVYIEGEACTVNMLLVRSSTAIRADFRTCMLFHEMYVRSVCNASSATVAGDTARDCEVRTSTVWESAMRVDTPHFAPLETAHTSSTATAGAVIPSRQYE